MPWQKLDLSNPFYTGSPHANQAKITDSAYSLTRRRDNVTEDAAAVTSDRAIVTAQNLKRSRQGMSFCGVQATRLGNKTNSGGRARVGRHLHSAAAGEGLVGGVRPLVEAAGGKQRGGG